MAITIDGSANTLAGLAEGGLPDAKIIEADLKDDAVSLAKMKAETQGGLIYYGSSGAPTQLAAGTSGQFLKTQGSGANPVWAAAGGGAFSKVYKSNSSTSTAMNEGNDPVRVGGTGCEVVLTPPAATTSYLLMFHTGMHIGDDDGQWGIQFRVSDDNWSSNSTINFMHNAYGCEDNEKWRGQRTYMKEWKPGSTSEWKIGVWAQVWSTDAIDVTFNSHSGQSQLTVFELNDTGKSGDWG